MSQAHLG